MASKEESKAERERKVFALFCRERGWCTPHCIIESRSPPEPDILFKRRWHLARAFEMVELIDQDYARTMQSDSSTRKQLADFYEALPLGRRSQLDQSYGDAEIIVSFQSGLTERRRAAVFDRLFKFLTDRPSGWSGVSLRPTELQPYVNEVVVARGTFKGPRFDVSSAVWVDDPCIEAIAEKMESTYVTPHRMELLAYIESNPMFPDHVWIPDLEDYCRLLARSQFGAIYVFDVSKKSVRFMWKRPTRLQRSMSWLRHAGANIISVSRGRLKRR